MSKEKPRTPHLNRKQISETSGFVLREERGEGSTNGAKTSGCHYGKRLDPHLASWTNISAGWNKHWNVRDKALQFLEENYFSDSG